MKLVYAIVHDEDGHAVTAELNKKGFSVTKLCSTGGFLRSGNTTLIIGVEANKVDEVITIVENKSKSRRQVMSSTMPMSGIDAMYMPYPVEITVGGATIFVLDVERFEKV